METKYAALVFQVGIANVFSLDAMTLDPEKRHAMRIYQGDFRGAVMLARGLKYAGCKVTTAACNKAGDIANEEWDTPLDEAPFRDSNEFQPVFS